MSYFWKRLKPFAVLRLGYGKIAKIHQEKLDKLGIKTVGVIETNNDRCRQASADGYQVFSDIKDVSNLEFDFWDICVSTCDHFQVIKQILALNPQAKILVEKPICYFKETAALSDLLRVKKCQIVVNETYCSSQKD